MIYTIIANAKSYDLPKKTLRVVKEIENVSELDRREGISIEQKFQAVLSFEQQLLGEESVAEIVGSNDLEEAELSEVTILFRKIVDAYAKPINDYHTAATQEALRKIPIDKVVEVSNAAAALKNVK